jgi:hypothetical protein
MLQGLKPIPNVTDRYPAYSFQTTQCFLFSMFFFFTLLGTNIDEMATAYHGLWQILKLGYH